MDTDPLPTVSVVIPVYNGAATLRECLDSVLALDYPRELMEVIVVDNASTDDTPALLASYGDSIVVVHEVVRGPAAARNRGIAEAKKDVIAFTDADCRVDSSWLARLVAPLGRPEVGVAGGRILAKQPCNRIEAFGDTIHDHEKALTVYKPHYVITMNWASRREVLEKTQFDVRFIRSEDVDLAYRLQMAGYEFVYVPDAVIYHSNERSLFGLGREGYQHGYWSVFTGKVHHEWLESLGHGRVHRRAYSAIISGLARAIRGPQRLEALCTVVFQTGKKIGKGIGSIRHRYRYL